MISELFRNLSSIVTIKGGKRLPAGKSLQEEPNSHPYIRVRDVGHRDLPRTGLEYVPDELFPPIARYIVEPNDVILSIVGTIGALSVVDARYHLASLTENCVKLHGLNRTDALYLFYYLSSERGQQEIHRGTVGAVQPKLPIYNIEKISVPWPDLARRAYIVSILGAFDDRITLLRETNATLEDIGQALFKSWFVDFDPVCAKLEGRYPEGMDEATAALFPDGLEESESGGVPRGWGIGTLADMSVLNPESWSTRKHPDVVAYIDLANAKDNEISEVIDYEFDEAPSRARRVLRNGDTIVGTVRPGNRSFAFIHAPPGNLTGSTGFAVLRPSAIENSEFVYLAATQDSSIEHLTHVADGGAYPAVRPDVVSALRCVVPPYQVLAAFHAVAAPLLEKVCENQLRVKALSILRDTLIPRLISGQLRFPYVEAQIEPIAA